MLRITHLKGPLRGTVHKFKDSMQSLRIGRGAECDILFPPEFNIIASNVHCVFEKDASNYEIRLDKKYAVFVDGERAIDGVELPHQATIALGPNGEVELLFEQIQKNDMPRTEFQGSGIDDAELIVGARSSIRKVVVGLVAAFVVVFFGYWQFSKVEIDINKRIEAANSMLEKLQSASDFSGAFASVEKSVYLVIMRNAAGDETALGTAWTTENGFLATNAHVAGIFESDSEAGTLDPQIDGFVRQAAQPFQEHKIEGIIIHPGYLAFQQAWKEYQPLVVDAMGNVEDYTFVLGYDVALLKVGEANKLSKPIPLAADDELRALRRGQLLALLGFPMENLAEFNLKAPVAQAQTGAITAITDFFRSTSFDASGQLIQHSIPVVGGASGSPIINQDGKVIALLNSGNAINLAGRRIDPGAKINYGQRVDLLSELFDYEAIDLEELQQYWNERFQLFVDREEYREWMESLPSIAKKWREIYEESGFSIHEYFRGKLRMESSLDPLLERPAIRKSIRSERSSRYLFIAESQEKIDIDLLLLPAEVKKLQDVDENIVSIENSESHVTFFEVDLEAGRDLQLFIYCACSDISEISESDINLNILYLDDQPDE